MVVLVDYTTVFDKHGKVTPCKLNRRDDIETGYFVALATAKLEVFWVMVTGVEGDLFKGESCFDLANDNVKVWDRIHFCPEHIVAIKTPFG